MDHRAPKAFGQPKSCPRITRMHANRNRNFCSISRSFGNATRRRKSFWIEPSTGTKSDARTPRTLEALCAKLFPSFAFIRVISGQKNRG